MFISAFLSATVLPGNSEVIFVALAVPKLMLGSLFNADILALILIATAGNSLGSLTTYGIGRWMPKFDPKKLPHFMGNKSATALWGDCFTFELAACSWRFIFVP